MVLVSHLYKFIYLKNYKVAGTSVESFFGQFCIDPSKREKYVFENDQHEEISRWGILGSRGNGRRTIWFNHISAKDVKHHLGSDMFDDYFKFCVVRNPYDLMVSSYFFEKRDLNKNSQIDFKTYCKKFINYNSNLLRMIIDDQPICQYYIRYENLVNDILVVLDKLGITDFDIKDLPHHKSEYNPHDKPYQDYYDDETKQIVKKIFQKEIEMFGYDF